MDSKVKLLCRAHGRLEKTKEGQLAKEEAMAGMSLREIVHTYDLEIGDIEALQVIQKYDPNCELER